MTKINKKILLITQWFDPEPTFKGLLFAKELVAHGFDVEVITGFPNYPGGKVYQGYRVKLIQREIIDKVLITRVPLYPSHDKSKVGRALNYISFFLSSFIYGLFFTKRPDVIYAYHPPLTVGVTATLLKVFRKVPVVLDIQDMWPDTLRATNMINNKLILNFISKICDIIYKSSSKIVVLSPGFKQLLEARNVPKNKIDVIYNWADEDLLRMPCYKTPIEMAKIKGFKVLFAGNIGRAQGLEVIVDAAIILKDQIPDVSFVILGKGLMLDSLKSLTKKSGLSNIHFIPAVGMEKVGDFLKAADALLVHLNPDPLFEITIPGKTQAYMAIGKPLVMGVKGDAEKLVSTAKCGFCFEPQNANSLANACIELAKLSPKELKRLGDNSISFYQKNLSVKIGVETFSKLFNKVINLNKKK